MGVIPGFLWQDPGRGRGETPARSCGGGEGQAREQLSTAEPGERLEFNLSPNLETWLCYTYSSVTLGRKHVPSPGSIPYRLLWRLDGRGLAQEAAQCHDLPMGLRGGGGG